MRRGLLLCLLLALLATSPNDSRAAAAIDELSVPGAIFGRVTSVSGDGGSVAGIVDPDDVYCCQAFVWEMGSIELIPLAYPPDPPPLGPQFQWHSQAWLSDDGETLVVVENAYGDTGGLSWTVRGFAWRGGISTQFSNMLVTVVGDSTFNAVVSGISDDGAVAFGSSGFRFHGIPGDWMHVFDTVSGVVVDPVLFCPPGYYDPPSSPAMFAGLNDASMDGGVVVGHHTCLDLNQIDGGEVPLKWNGSFASYPAIYAARLFGEAEVVSGDGVVVAGVSNTPLGVQSWIWSESTTRFVANLPGMSGFLPRVTHLSHDGEVVVGTVQTVFGRVTFRLQDGVMQLIELPGDLFESQPVAISSDGSVIVGMGHGVTGEEPYYWSSMAGVRSLKGVLELEMGLDLTDWVLGSVVDMSNDGLVVVGEGLHMGSAVGFRAELESPAAVPGPAGSALGLVALISTLLAATMVWRASAAY